MSKYNVNDMYMHAVGAGKRLLSNFSADFWQEYVNNYSTYDALFRRSFLSFRYFLQADGETIAQVTDNFILDVKSHLMVNAKKYEELYRIYVIPDEDLNLTDNYYLEEKMDRNTTHNNNTTQATYTDKVDETMGARSDSGSITYAEQTNTDTNSLGEQKNESKLTKGAQTTTSTNKVAPYDSDDFKNDSQSEVVEGQRVDDTKETIGAKTDTLTRVIGGKTDTTSSTQGAQTNSTTMTNGARSGSDSGTGTEDYTLTRRGNIGTLAPVDMLVKHTDYWTVYEFYTMIFRDIAKELLLI